MFMQKKSLPIFSSEAEERSFWESHDSSDYFDWSQAENVSMPNLRATDDKDLEEPSGRNEGT